MVYLMIFPEFIDYPLVVSSLYTNDQDFHGCDSTTLALALVHNLVAPNQITTQSIQKKYFLFILKQIRI